MLAPKRALRRWVIPNDARHDRGAPKSGSKTVTFGRCVPKLGFPDA